MLRMYICACSLCLKLRGFMTTIVCLSVADASWLRDMLCIVQSRDVWVKLYRSNPRIKKNPCFKFRLWKSEWRYKILNRTTYTQTQHNLVALQNEIWLYILQELNEYCRSNWGKIVQIC